MSEQTLRRKLFLAGKAAQPVEKKGESEDGSYKFARAADVLAEASRVLEKQSIVVVPSIDDVELRFGKTGALAKVSMSFEIADTKSEDTLTKTWIGTGWDRPGDKAVYKAVTGGTKYFYASLLGLAFDDDPEGARIAGEGVTTDADMARARQDFAAEAPDITPAIKPLPESDLPEPDWTGVGLGEEAAHV